MKKANTKNRSAGIKPSSKAAKQAGAKQRSTYLPNRILLVTVVANIRAFLLEYIPNSAIKCRVSQQTGSTDIERWLMPKELLDRTFHGQQSVELRDDFWARCCAGYMTRHKISGDRTQPINITGSRRSNDVQAFLDFVAWALNRQEPVQTSGTARFGCPFFPRTKHDTLLIRSNVADGGIEISGSKHSSVWTGVEYEPPKPRGSDRSCTWISRDYPHLSAWELFAKEYVRDVKRGVHSALAGLSIFFDRYLANAGKPNTPGEKLDPECAKRPIADQFSADALLLRESKDRVPTNLDVLSNAKDKATLRTIRDGFIPYILSHHCSLVENDQVQLLPEYWNPFRGIDLEDANWSQPSESNRPAMPYAWIRRLRGILAQGPHFCDWQWAQMAQRSMRGNSPDWFEVDWNLIDGSDPDCVWRQRTTGFESKGNERTFYEIWSPVRWVALLVKLNTALRTMQVRVLDSGESDGWRFDLRQWAAHTYPINTGTGDLTSNGLETAAEGVQIGSGASSGPWVANDVKSRNQALFTSIAPQNALRKKGGKSDPNGWANGVLRAIKDENPRGGQQRLTTVMYVNTNKTADAKKEGAAKGFEVPLPLISCPLPPGDAYWVRQGEQQSALQPQFASTRQLKDWLDELGENSHWWLAKLRDWQEKYNPIDRRVEWKELSGTRLITEKSDEQYEMYRPSCFLFREPCMSTSKNHPGPAYPLPDGVVGAAWWALLKELQDRLAAERPEGTQEESLVDDDSGHVSKSCKYDLHSIRVSIITALIVDGKVPIHFVQKMVGHSRLIMTIYYTKINPLNMAEEISGGFKRAREKEVEAEKQFLKNGAIEDVRAKAVFNDETSALQALGIYKSPKERNVVMWIRKLGGICPVGGVSYDTEGGLKAGCFNGGPQASKGQYAPVEGGPGTCVNCRWFVSLLRHIGELQAIADASNYRLHEFKEKAALQNQKIERIEDDWSVKESERGALTPAQHMQFNLELDAAESIRDGYLESAAIDMLTAANACKLILRLADLEMLTPAESESTLITNAREGDLKVILGETTSAMLHAARVSIHSEIHPELNVPSATLRAAMMLARKLQEEDIDPFTLLGLPENLQMKAINALMKHTASLFDPQNLEIGLSKAAALIESNHKLSQLTGIRKERLQDWIVGCSLGNTEIPAVATAKFDTLLINKDEGESK